MSSQGSDSSRCFRILEVGVINTHQLVFGVDLTGFLRERSLECHAHHMKLSVLIFMLHLMHAFPCFQSYRMAWLPPCGNHTAPRNAAGRPPNPVRHEMTISAAAQGPLNPF